MIELVACVDFGSTFTKALLVDVGSGEVTAAAESPTTVDTDVLEGWSACLTALRRVHPGVDAAPVLACSSAGGGLRVAVVGNEDLVTAEAGRRVALSSGGKVVHVGVGGLAAPADTAALLSTTPDLVLLVGGTDGGNSEVLLGAATRLAASRWPGPVVVAGNVEVAAAAVDVLTAAGVPAERADNVVPQIGVLRPEPARSAIRTAFLRHVIGGKHLSASAEFLDMVQGPTPDVVLSGVELLAGGPGGSLPGVGDVVVVDVGGATTDVHSVVRVDPEESGLARHVVAPTAVTRTVEGDLGMRWSAATTVELGASAGLLAPHDAAGLVAAARVRTADPAYLPSDDADARADLAIAGLATVVALRRHAGRARVVFGPDGRVVERDGKDLREVALLVGSGGVLRHTSPAAALAVLTGVTGADLPGGWLLPEAPQVVVDRTYVLAAAGLLGRRHPQTAHALLRRYVADRRPAPAPTSPEGTA
ncbi:MAG: glutamate mutase L [Nocardioidaceae bacterium]